MPNQTSSIKVVSRNTLPKEKIANAMIRKSVMV